MTLLATSRNTLVNPFELKVEDVHYRDIATALAKICRWGGMCHEFYSVAEHSVRVSSRAAKLVGERRTPDDVMLVRQYALLHDAAEAYLGDLRLPLKRLPQFAFYRRLEHDILATIHESAGLDPLCPEWISDLIKIADAEERDDEHAELMVKRDGGLTLDWRAAENLYVAHLRLCFERWALL